MYGDIAAKLESRGRRLLRLRVTLAMALGTLLRDRIAGAKFQAACMRTTFVADMLVVVQDGVMMMAVFALAAVCERRLCRRKQRRHPNEALRN